MSRPKIPKLLNCKEFAAVKGVGYSTVKQWLVDGRLPEAQKVGGYYWVIPANAILVPKGAADIPLDLIEHVPNEYLIHRDYGRKTVEAPGLKPIREACGMNKSELHRASGVGMGTIWRAENGYEIQPATLYKLAIALDVDYVELLRRQW